MTVEHPGEKGPVASPTAGPALGPAPQQISTMKHVDSLPVFGWVRPDFCPASQNQYGACGFANHLHVRPAPAL
jgi:hypothetical protein